jgi:hypothetical protein
VSHILSQESLHTLGIWEKSLAFGLTGLIIERLLLQLGTPSPFSGCLNTVSTTLLIQLA